ncbi:uncharacterized protein [Heptranchias perlo]|uniref:uncharacterized protein n=1 Tax=Heptranchias perlo TaxID=212740 RepID=UPI0035597DF3
MVQPENQSKKGSLIRRMLFYIIRICKLSENKTEDDSDDYMKLVDKLRETKLAPYQMPICVSCSKPHINQYLLPCEHIVCETCFIGKDQEDVVNLKCPQCQVEYFISWHNQLDLKHIYSAVNTEARSTQQIDHHFNQKKGEPDPTSIFCEICNVESNCHPDSVSSNANHCRKSLKPLSHSRSPAPFGEHRKRHPFNPFSNTNQYHVLDAVPDPQECPETGNHNNQSLPKAPPPDERETDLSGSPIENIRLLGQSKQK